MLGVGLGNRLHGAATLTAGAAIDKTPAAFVFTDQTDVPVSDVRTSNEITVTDTNESTAVSITGGTYSRNGGAYTSAAGTAFPGDTFTVRHTSSASNSTATNTVLTIGGVSDTFTSTTAVSESYGPELLGNTDFASGADWSLGSNTAISGGKLRFTGNGQASSDGTEATMTEGLTYHVVYTIVSISTGSVSPAAGDTFGTARTSSGTYTQDIVCGLIEEFGFQLTSVASDAVVGPVSVKEAQ